MTNGRTLPPAVVAARTELTKANDELARYTGFFNRLCRELKTLPEWNNTPWDHTENDKISIQFVESVLEDLIPRHKLMHMAIMQAGRLLDAEEVSDEEWADLYSDVKDLMDNKHVNTDGA